MERAETGLERAAARRWAGIGRSAHPDAAAAGGEAARAALAGREDVGLLLLFSSSAYDLAAVAAAVDAESGGVPVAGCSATGEIHGAEVGQGSVVVLALGGDGFSVSAAAVPGGDPREAGASVAACVGDVADRPHRTLLLFVDGHAAHKPDVIRGAYSVAGAGVALAGGIAAPVVGGGSGVVLADEVFQDAVVGVAIGSEAPIGVGARHGWQPTGEPMLVTAAEPGAILELDHRPAREVYAERIGADRLTNALAGAHPLGIERRIGEPAARHVTVGRHVPDGALGCHVPAGALVRVLTGGHDAVLSAGADACDEALAALGGAEPLALAVFACEARLRFFGELAGSPEIALIAERAGGAPLAGACTHGEIARTRGTVGFHHNTVVVLAVA